MRRVSVSLVSIRRGLSQVISNGNRVVYEAAMGSALKRVKLLSLASCGMTCAGSPALVALGEGTPAAWAMGGLIMTFGVMTTSVLHWFSKTYVMSMAVESGPADREGTTLVVEKLNFWARRRRMEFQLENVGKPRDGIRPLVTFTAKGIPLFVECDGFKDRELLRRMLPWRAEEFPDGDESHEDVNEEEEKSKL